MLNQQNATICQHSELKTVKQTTDTHNELLIVGQVLLAVQCSRQEEPEIVETSVQVDLTEFQLTQQEAEKLEKILKRVNFALTDAFSEVCLAASVTSDVIAK